MADFDASCFSSKEERDLLLSIAGLDASSNLLTHLRGMECLSNLVKLDVSKNRLAGAPLSGLPLALKTLFLSNNQVTSLKGLSPLRHLEFLDVSHNALTSLTGAADFLPPSIVTLVASHNRITQIVAADCRRPALPPSLTDLDVSHNLINSVEEFQPLKGCQSLRTLRVDSNPVVLGSMAYRSPSLLQRLLPSTIELHCGVPGDPCNHDALPRAIERPQQPRIHTDIGAMPGPHEVTAKSIARPPAPGAQGQAHVQIAANDDSNRAATLDIRRELAATKEALSRALSENQALREENERLKASRVTDRRTDAKTTLAAVPHASLNRVAQISSPSVFAAHLHASHSSRPAAAVPARMVAPNEVRTSAPSGTNVARASPLSLDRSRSLAVRVSPRESQRKPPAVQPTLRRSHSAPVKASPQQKVSARNGGSSLDASRASNASSTKSVTFGASYFYSPPQHYR